MKKGLVIVNTGNGKGKTTAALGQMFRAFGHQLNVCMIQFIKGSWTYGELLSKERFNDLLDFHVMGKGFTFKSDNLEEDKKIAKKGWEIAKAALTSDKYFMVILDEITYLLNYNFIDTEEVLECIQKRRKDLHVIITGRDAPQSIISAADLVTRMESEKHPFDTGIKGQKGIEF
ncbi:Cob(I)yrinic acid a,c-diamide adenosyltransferase [Candidatus Magnetomorum sp. HK-1]|nr:Cob(I)yrinic acid a,c-diamide adenosyltransferase [Candidatus Magnetomorum sp. HK-1]